MTSPDEIGRVGGSERELAERAGPDGSPYRYFVAFSHHGSLGTYIADGFGNALITRPAPIVTIEDVHGIARYIETLPRPDGLHPRNVVVLWWRRFEDDPAGRA